MIGPANGIKKSIDGKPCVYYDGYWIRWYEPQSDDYASKKKMIDQLTKRVFHHAEPGINTPGYRLDQIRRIFEYETDPARKRVKGGMLAGSLLNRGSDILSSIVDLQEAGVKIEQGNPLLRECGKCFMEALEMGKNIKLSRGGEGLDELWGEPFRVFTLTMEQFYESRYIKIAQTMSEIDNITAALTKVAKKTPTLAEANSKIIELGECAKLTCETMRTDPVIFDVWPRYVAAKEALEDFLSNYEQQAPEITNGNKKVFELIRQGGNLLVSLATVRVPMPETTKLLLQKCEELKN